MDIQVRERPSIVQYDDLLVIVMMKDGDNDDVLTLVDVVVICDMFINRLPSGLASSSSAGGSVDDHHIHINAHHRLTIRL